MNIERMLHLADQLENPTDPRLEKVTFDMSQFHSHETLPTTGQVIDCGTAACIGGHACILFGAVYMSPFEAMDALGLTYHQMGDLFFNVHGYVSPGVPMAEITREQATRAVRRMAKEHVDAELEKLETAETEELVPA